MSVERYDTLSVRNAIVFETEQFVRQMYITWIYTHFLQPITQL